MISIAMLGLLAIFMTILALFLGGVGVIVFVLFGDVILLMATIATIRKTHTYFKNKKKK